MESSKEKVSGRASWCAHGCAVPGCRDYKQSKLEGTTFHTFPTGDIARCRRWLVAIRNVNYAVNMSAAKMKSVRVCSKHFTEEDYERDLKSSLMGNTPRRRLKSTAIPSVFPWSGTAVPIYRGALAKRRHAEIMSTIDLTTPAKNKDETFGLSAAGMPVHPDPAPCPRPLQPSSPMSLPKKQQRQVEAMGLETVSRPPCSPERLALEGTDDMPLQQQIEDEPTSSPMDTSFCSSLGDTETSPDYKLPTSQSSSIDSSIDSEIYSDVWDQRKWIVNESNLMQLFKRCPECGSGIIDTCKIVKGSQIKISWECVKRHTGSWQSCPDVREMPQTNIVSMASVLFTGSTFTEIKDWADLCKVQLPESTTFYEYQSSYFLPVIKEEYDLQQKSILATMIEDANAGKPVHLCGDGRSDSPGFSAKYTTYSIMDDWTKRIIQSDVIQVTETTSSVAMEPLGFRRGLSSLLEQGLPIDIVTTDRSSSIRKIMKEEFPQINHQVDPWHCSKGISRKLRTLAKKRSNADLLPWVKSVGNHLWYSCASCRGSVVELKRIWLSILYHICGIHSWTENGEEYTCGHAELTEEQHSRKKWLSKGTEVYRVFSAVVQNRYLMKDLDQMADFKHTGMLESYHSTLLKYMPKRLHFSYQCMGGRTQLSVLDHNTNVLREKATKATGEEVHKYVYQKQSADWVEKNVYDPKKYTFREKLIEKVLERRLDEDVLYKDPSSCLPRPDFPKNIARKPRPSTQELSEKHRTRM